MISKIVPTNVKDELSELLKRKKIDGKTNQTTNSKRRVVRGIRGK